LKTKDNNPKICPNLALRTVFFDAEMNPLRIVRKPCLRIQGTVGMEKRKEKKRNEKGKTQALRR